MPLLKLVASILVIPALTASHADWETTQPHFPITEMRWMVYPREFSPTLRLIVPDEDTTQLAGKGNLRRYDVHVAKMFETTYFLCQKREETRWVDWFYEAAKEKAYMGRFKIPCSLARDVVAAYGLGSLEQTTLQRELEGDASTDYKTRVESLEYFVPALRLTGNKIPKWMNFVQQVRPDFTIAIADPEIPIQQLLQPFREKIHIPILLPNSLLSSNAVYISFQVDKSGYIAEFSYWPDCTGTICYIASIGAKEKGELISPDSHEWKYFKYVQLSNGITGVAASSCGAYCISVVQWEYHGTIYTVRSKAHFTKLDKSFIPLANEAIEAGSR